jgi:Uma2 family endonuclease
MSQRVIDSNQKRTLPPQEHPRSPRESLPSMYDLPSEEVGESGLPDEFHVFQSQLLRETFEPQNYSPDEVFVGTDINLYFDIKHPGWYKRPDWFASVGVPRLYDGKDLRLSYLVWQEGVNPLVVVELLSPSTEKEDLGQSAKAKASTKTSTKTNNSTSAKTRATNQPPSKWEVYQTILRVPFYFTYDHLTQQIRAFRLNGDGYISFLPDKEGRFSLPSINVYLGLWQGSYQNINETWLRWFDEQGSVIATALERTTQEKERERAEKEQERAEKEALADKLEKADQEKERERVEKETLAEKLASLNSKLIAMGIDPSNL